MDKEVVQGKKVDFPTAILIVLTIVVIMIVGLGFLELPTVTIFIVTLVVISVIALLKGFEMKEIQGHIVNGTKNSVEVILILMSAGMIVGSWIIAGVVPSIIYYGLKMLNPSYFLALGFILCCVTSFFTGSSYTAIGTLGVAFMGIGYGLGINPGITAGMVVSGAVFGDKMSPFSDTTVLAAAVADTDIFLHIRAMLLTTGPAFFISLILYFIIGSKFSGTNMDLENINSITNIIGEYFVVSPFLLLIPVITIVLAILKVPTLIALTIGAITGVIVGGIIQPFTLAEVLNSLTNGVVYDFGNEAVNRLLNRGGISSMMSTVSLTILALAFGEILQEIGVLEILLSKIQRIIDVPRNLVLTTLATSLLTVCLTASQYVAVLLPGEIFREQYKKLKLAPYLLSRTLEDGGTVFAFIVPWSMAAIYSSGVLEVSPYEYLPYAFLPVLCPLISIFLTVTGLGIIGEDGKRYKKPKSVKKKVKA